MATAQVWRMRARACACECKCGSGHGVIVRTHMGVGVGVGLRVSESERRSVYCARGCVGWVGCKCMHATWHSSSSMKPVSTAIQ